METLVIQREDILKTCLKFRDEEKFDFMLDLCGVDYPDRSEARFEVVYHLYSSAANRRIRLKVNLPESRPEVASVASVWPAANWFERECFDLFGVKFLGHPNLKRLLLYEGFVGHPLRKDYPIGKRQFIPTPADLRGVADSTDGLWINFGPAHPATHGAFRLMLKLDGEKIIDAIPEIGYLHRCFEKESEDHTYTQVIPYTDRLNYCSPLMNNVGYCMAAEKLLGIEIPERAKYIRVLVAEISRIIDHLVAIGTNVVDMGALTNYWYTFNIREYVYDWIERLCGARLTTTYTRIGGVARDLPPDTKKDITSILKKLDRAVKDVTGLLVKNRIFLDRAKGVGAISPERAIAYGFTGPCLRAAGVAYDVRRADAYYHYDEFDWDVPVGENGDTYDRIMIRFEEIRQSVRIIEQVLRKMPDGEIMINKHDVALPSKAATYNTIEGLMDHFKLITGGICPPSGEVYSSTEAANGELGFYIVSDGSAKPHRIKVRPPCFAIYQAYPELIKGHMVADAVAVLGSLNVIAGELDR